MKTLRHNIMSFLIIISFLLTGCKKEIIVPNSECKKVIGSWEWSYSTGGFGMAIKTPETEGYSKTTEFDKNGNQFTYIDNNKVGVNQFSFKIEPSIYVSGNDYLIIYKNGKNESQKISHSFEFADTKTLVLSEQCYDCYSHVYIKK